MIYLDHNATTPLAPAVRDAMLPWVGGDFGNPSSAHTIGQTARAAVDEARARVAGQLGCAPGEVVFTGGGTEADLLALVGSALAAGTPPTGRVVISAIEHEAVLEAAALLGRLGMTVTEVRPGPDGRVDAQRFIDACAPDTVVASLMLASNETGVLQPVAEVAAALRSRPVVVHTDAVQAIGKVPVSFADLDVDLLSLSGHKFGGPKGVGALLVRHGQQLAPLMGGSQEAGRRGGTHNVAAIVGLGQAALGIDVRLEQMRSRGAERDRLEAELGRRLGDVMVHGGSAPRVPNTASVAFAGVDAAALLMRLDLADLCVSRGSACASGAEAPSHVLRAMDVAPAWALATLRLSLGVETRATEIEQAIELIVGAVEAQRAATRSNL